MKNDFDLLNLLNKSNLRNKIISNWSVGEHIDHICNVVSSIDRTLRDSDPNLNSEKFNFGKLFVLTFGYIPRGRGKSPNDVLPNIKIDSIELRDKINLIGGIRDGMNNLNHGHWIIHPIFGVLKCKNALKFTDIHTRHHVKIINKIMRN